MLLSIIMPLDLANFEVDVVDVDVDLDVELEVDGDVEFEVNVVDEVDEEVLDDVVDEVVDDDEVVDGDVICCSVIALLFSAMCCTPLNVAVPPRE